MQVGKSELPFDTGIQLMVIAQDNLLNSLGIGCNFFKTTYGFLGSVSTYSLLLTLFRYARSKMYILIGWTNISSKYFLQMTGLIVTYGIIVIQMRTLPYATQ